jgi:nicotinate-nucleotide pyrophosphorylase
MKSLVPSWKKWLETGIEEDSAAFDWTARTTARARGTRTDDMIEADLIAKGHGIWAGEIGLCALEILSREHGLPIRVKDPAQDGAKVAPKQKIVFS